MCRWTPARLCSACVSCWPPHLAPWSEVCVVEGGPGVRCPRPQSWVCAHPVLTDGKGGSAVDPRWPQARGVHSQRQTISIISASPGAIMEAALQHCVVHRESMWLAGPVHLGRGEHMHASGCWRVITWFDECLDSWQQRQARLQQVHDLNISQLRMLCLPLVLYFLLCSF